jgi:ribosomal protein S13
MTGKRATPAQRQADAKGVPAVDKKKNEKEKIFAMWTGIIFFMVLIFIFWIFILRADFKNNQRVEQESGFNWTGIKQELSQTMQEIRGSLGEINELREEISKEAEEEALSEEQIEELKNKIINQKMIEENIATSSDEIIND